MTRGYFKRPCINLIFFALLISLIVFIKSTESKVHHKKISRKNSYKRDKPHGAQQNKRSDLDDEKEHNITIIYDKVTGATNNLKKHSKKQNVLKRQKASSVAGSKRQFASEPSVSGMFLTTPFGDVDKVKDGGYVPIGPVDTILGGDVNDESDRNTEPFLGGKEPRVNHVASHVHRYYGKTKHVYEQDSVIKTQGGVINGGFLPSETLHGRVSYEHDTKHFGEPDEHTIDLHPEQKQTFHNPVHINVKGYEKMQGGYVKGGTLNIKSYKGHLLYDQNSKQVDENIDGIPLHPEQKSLYYRPVHVKIAGVEKTQVGFVNGGFLQKVPLLRDGPATKEHTEPGAQAIVPHQTVYDNSPKHIFQSGMEQTQAGFVDAGFLQKHITNMKVKGAHHIVRKPIHIEDPHTETSYETVVNHGEVHEHPCLNGGVYISMVHDTYQCICPEGFIGKTCQEKNYCHPCPCKNHGDCQQKKEEPFYKCQCKRGFYGVNCEKKDPCFPNPCQNHGVCTHDGSVSSCVCPNRFRGKRCEVLNNCDPDPCTNGGRCIELKGEGKFQCECLPMYRGILCKKRSYCFSKPCRNGGTCREGEDHFVCDCPKGFSGPACTDRLCHPNPCMNGGTCIEDGDKFKCVCLPWTAGNLCEESRPCLTNPCMHGGRCIDSYSGFHWSFGPLQYYCVCMRPYKGMVCEKHACQNCHKNAHCDVDKCVCDDGYEGNGETCRKVDTPCKPNPCSNKGICTEISSYCNGNICGFKCACPDPYMPPLCKHKNPCQPDPCVNGECTPINGGNFECRCDPGFRGEQCADRDACHPNPCQHGGVCKDTDGTAVCECIGQWKGPYCKDCNCPVKSVAGSPILSCSQEGQCICSIGYIPDLHKGICERQLASAEQRPCLSSPCENGGVCKEIGNGNYVCVCPKGFSGKVCQHRSPCLPGPCLNDGLCMEKDGKFLGCKCLPGFLPPLCRKPEVVHGPCQPNPCLQNGVCIVNGNAYDCQCPDRYTGPNCNVDKCGKCDQNAECIRGQCKCRPGYIGNGYTCEQEMCEATCVEWSSCIDGQCVCNPGHTQVYNKCVPKPVPQNEIIEFETERILSQQKEDRERLEMKDKAKHERNKEEEESITVLHTSKAPPLLPPTKRPNLVLPTRVVVIEPKTTMQTTLDTTIEPKTNSIGKPESEGAGPPGSKPLTTEGEAALEEFKVGPPGRKSGSPGSSTEETGPPGSKRQLLTDEQDDEDNEFADREKSNHQNKDNYLFILKTFDSIS